MDHGKTPGGGVESPDQAADAGMKEVERKVLIFVIVFGFCVMGIALLVKYIMTGVAIKDRLGWVMFALQIALGIALPIAIFSRKPAERNGSAGAKS